MIDVVFVHGWSFDARIWGAVLPLLSGIRPHMVEMGFTGQPGNTDAPLPHDAILVGHSYGVQWLLENLPERPRALISIAGFDCFHRYKTAREMRAMGMALRRAPDALLLDFYTRCGAGDLYESIEPDEPRLSAGLARLETADAKAQHDALPCPIIALAATNDPIVPKDMSAQIWARDHLHWLDTDSHALPHTHPQWCAAHIQKVIDGQHS